MFVYFLISFGTLGRILTLSQNITQTSNVGVINEKQNKNPIVERA